VRVDRVVAGPPGVVGGGVSLNFGEFLSESAAEVSLMDRMELGRCVIGVVVERWKVAFCLCCGGVRGSVMEKVF
jgi:hypothetical protein